MAIATYTVDALDVASAGSGADVDKEHFTLLDSLNFVVAVLSCAHHSFQNRALYVDLDVHLRHTSRVTDDITDHVVRASELRVDLGAHRN